MAIEFCVFGHFGWLTRDAVHSADCRIDSVVKWLIHVSSIVTHLCKKTPFCCIETVANNVLNCQRVVIFDWLWVNVAPTFNTAFSLTNVHTKWWIYCILISSTLLRSYATSIYYWPKRVCGVFWCFPGQLPNLGDLSVQHHLCQYNRVLSQHTTYYTFFPTKQSLNNTYQAVALLDQYFSHQKPMLYQQRKFRFFHCFENLQQ